MSEDNQRKSIVPSYDCEEVEIEVRPRTRLMVYSALICVVLSVILWVIGSDCSPSYRIPTVSIAVVCIVACPIFLLYACWIGLTERPQKRKVMRSRSDSDPPVIH